MTSPYSSFTFAQELGLQDLPAPNELKAVVGRRNLSNQMVEKKMRAPKPLVGIKPTRRTLVYPNTQNFYPT
jgi:hypothetical protein